MTLFSLNRARAATGYGAAKSTCCFRSKADGELGTAQAVLNNNSAIDPLLTEEGGNSLEG